MALDSWKCVETIFTINALMFPEETEWYFIFLKMLRLYIGNNIITQLDNESWISLFKGEITLKFILFLLWRKINYTCTYHSLVYALIYCEKNIIDLFDYSCYSIILLSHIFTIFIIRDNHMHEIGESWKVKGANRIWKKQ